MEFQGFNAMIGEKLTFAPQRIIAKGEGLARYMTTREHMATQIMAALLTDPYSDMHEAAKTAVRAADMLIKELNGEHNGE